MIHESGLLALWAVGVFIFGFGAFAWMRSYNKVAATVLLVIGGVLFSIPIFVLQSA